MTTSLPRVTLNAKRELLTQKGLPISQSDQRQSLLIDDSPNNHGKYKAPIARVNTAMFLPSGDSIGAPPYCGFLKKSATGIDLSAYAGKQTPPSAAIAAEINAKLICFLMIFVLFLVIFYFIISNEIKNAGTLRFRHSVCVLLLKFVVNS
jgi:hypothetical protein